MSGLKNRVKNSIAQKIFAAVLCVIVLTVMSFFFSTYFIMRFQMERKSQESARKDIMIITEKMDMFFKGIEDASIKMLASDASQELLKNSEQFLEVNEKQKYKTYGLINETLQSVFTQDDVYRTIIFYDLEANAYPELNIELNQERRIAQQKQVEAFLEGDKNAEWLALHKSPWKAKNPKKEEDCISYLRKVYAGRSGKLIGVMELEIYAQSIIDLYTTISDSGYGIYIVDERHCIQSSSVRKKMYETLDSTEWYQELDEQYNEKDFSVVSSHNSLYMMKEYPPLGWRIIMTLPMSIYKKDINIFTKVDIGLGILVLLFGIVLSGRLILSITKPLSSITQTIQGIGKGNLEKRIEGIYNGEIQLLTDEFNKMLDRTNALMEQNVQTEKKKRKFERALIQLQMTPHFFYNILESICGLIVIDDKKLAIHTIQLLANFYRNVLSKGAEQIPIEKEIEIAANYLDIMMICYPGMIQYEIDCQENLKSYLIIKLTLQPILENAVYHGIIAQGQKGSILVKISEREEDIRIVIEDDGAGMSKERLQKLMKGEDSGFSMNSFGVRNTDERLKLFFGKEYGLRIVSKEGKGTSVEIKIPKIGE